MITKFEIEGLLLIDPRKFHDERGYFFESFNTAKYHEMLGVDHVFVQDNVSVSKKNVLRGLHFQHPPMAQGKLVSVLNGCVIDVAVDIRKNSPTYGQHCMVELSRENGLQFWIPPGFAHGFLALEDETVFNYKCTNYYSPVHEETLLWDDIDLKINWPIQNPIISNKDLVGKIFSNFETTFITK
ncbi:MAG: dTDP-4-dehydrorhamnose 3,5-epimerase [Bacteroidota bacterium]|jgi:dTDP-4-dehydrorhamnose 3,5-epimerase